MRRMFSRLAILVVALAAFAAGPAAAQTLSVDIVGGVKTATPIAVVPFAQAGGAPLPTDIADVIRTDFNRSGKFRSLEKNDIVETPSQGSDIKFATWRLLKQDYLTIGRISDAGGGMVKVEYELWDVNRQQSLLAQSFTAPTGDLRGVAHQIADQIYEKITGVRGAFWTRIAYVTAVGTGNNTTYSLIVADSDGFNPQVVARSRESLLSPAWSPDGSKLAYVTFESGQSALVIQTLSNGAIRQVARFPRHNGAPAFSPDGSKLAFALSKTGSLNLYVMDLASGQIRQLTDGRYNSTEPAWFPDSQNLAYTSDQAGAPQVYKINVNGGASQRLTWEGAQNQDSDVSADGKTLVMVSTNGGAQHIAKQDLDSGAVQTLSNSYLDETPSLAPNGTMVIYSSTQGYGSVLQLVSTDGRFKARLPATDGQVSFPAWSPYL